MPIDIATLTRAIEPERTILLFGAGSSVPSGAPCVSDLQAHFAKSFDVPVGDYSLAEQTGIIEARFRDRVRLILELRKSFVGLRPTGALLNLPLYNWKSIFTTNYDELIEECYRRKNRDIAVYTTNMDFHVRQNPESVQLFKLHGTLHKDEAFGDKSRIILTQGDYDLTEDYRQDLYTRLKSDLAGAQLVIIGHSLADRDVRDIVDRALKLRASSGSATKISLLMYKPDEGRAGLFEARGLEVCFSGLDEFFGGMVQHIVSEPPRLALSIDPLDSVPALRTSTIDVSHSLGLPANASAMYNGWPIYFPDIKAGLTFQRDVAKDIERNLLSESGKPIAILLGASGVGKTSAARQVLAALTAVGFAWEHKSDRPLMADRWRQVAKMLKHDGKTGALLIDNAHSELSQVNDLAEFLADDENVALKIILVSTNHQWNLRVKSSSVHKNSKIYNLSIVGSAEIDRLVNLIETCVPIRALVANNFAGFNRAEKRRRLIQKCSDDMFVCLKNIFSSDKLDDILLREYADLDAGSQEIYRAVAAMESAGVHVHRQLVVRMLGIRADAVSAVLSKLEDIIHEEAVDEREGVYAWHGRHKVIMDIIANHKYYDVRKRIDLFEEVINVISPTYDIEIRTIRDLCNLETGLATIMDKSQQNVLLRRMISIAPGERVPRHRLLRNLIDMNEFDLAETELRIFQNDFKLDGPAVRYKIVLAVARAVRSPGLMREDRIFLIEKAREIASAAVTRYRMHKGILTAYCEVGIETAKLTGRSEVFDNAIAELKSAEERIGDPTISRSIANLLRRMSNIAFEVPDYSEALVEED